MTPDHSPTGLTRDPREPHEDELGLVPVAGMCAETRHGVPRSPLQSSLEVVLRLASLDAVRNTLYWAAAILAVSLDVLTLVAAFL